MKHQYKSNWCLIREVSAREFYLAKTLSYNRKLGLIQRRKRGFLANKFLKQGSRGKGEIKNYKSNYDEFRDF
jgi:hypothetical protein